MLHSLLHNHIKHIISCFAQSLIVLRWPCVVDRTLKSSYHFPLGCDRREKENDEHLRWQFLKCSSVHKDSFRIFYSSKYIFKKRSKKKKNTRAIQISASSIIKSMLSSDRSRFKSGILLLVSVVVHHAILPQNVGFATDDTYSGLTRLMVIFPQILPMELVIKWTCYLCR